MVRVGVIAPSSPVPRVELSQGIEHLRREGFDVRVHEQCGQQHFTFAGTDDKRCAALLDFAFDPGVDVIWCGRGGYGATRLLPLLDAVTRQRGLPPRKLLVGYSDVTVLHEYARTRWGWATLHAAMPASESFGQFDPVHWQATLQLVRGQPVQTPWPAPLEFIHHAPSEVIEGELVGGTLTLWACLAGTSYAPDARGGKILFFEDVGEPWYRIDRMVTQLRQSGAFDGARAIILGDFKDCRDEVHTVRRDPASDEKVPLRPFYEAREAIEQIFGAFPIPVAVGLPVGHGPNYAPLPLGAKYSLAPDGQLSLHQWGWLESPSAGAVAE
jgi:muramoyltetrapeptide carboxypeptidase